MSNGVVNCHGDTLGVPSHIGLPDADHKPAGMPQRSPCPRVAGTIGGDLRNPVRGVGAALELPPELCPVPTVPKIAVTEDRDAGIDEYHVRSSKNRSDVSSISKPSRRQGSAEEHLGLGVRRGVPAFDNRARKRSRYEAFEAWDREPRPRSSVLHVRSVVCRQFRET